MAQADPNLRGFDIGVILIFEPFDVRRLLLADSPTAPYRGAILIFTSHESPITGSDFCYEVLKWPFFRLRKN